MRALPLIGLALGGGFVVWAIIDAQSAGAAYRKGRKKIEDTTGIRLPRPDIMVKGPSTPEEFGILVDVLEEEAAAACSANLSATDAAFGDLVARRTLSRLYPEFPWPAITGDHASTLELQGLLRYIAAGKGRQALCEEPAQPEEIDTDDGIEPAPLS